ncbi:hypothetical protein [Puerhibacterium puerhi]|uniref:hypothetical protein n=1 Tax=Puerhibacterium puerhi TaxID=2692623 RepID=UPI00135C69B3|nr:hypothetical protein [Puerhibacterium puerhi]
MTPTCDQHDWRVVVDPAADGHTVWGCATCTLTVPGCLHCGHRLEHTALTVCDRCVTAGRRLVLDVLDDLDRFPYTVLEVTGLRSARYDLVRTTSSDDDLRLPFGLDAHIADPAAGFTGAKHPETALDVLREWANTWADFRGEPHPHTWETYLADHTLWALQNPNDSDWNQYQHEARQVRTTVRRILGITPVPEGTPCPDCGGTTVRDWQPRADHTPTHEADPATHRRGLPTEGLADTVRCTRCHRSWDTTTDLHLTALAAMETLPGHRPWALLTFAELVLALSGRVGRQTIATWIHRGHLRPMQGPWPRSEKRVRRRRDGTTERLYRLGDAFALLAAASAPASTAIVQP